MSDEHLSIADRWMRNYEQEHPEVLAQGFRRPQPNQNAWQPSSLSSETTSEVTKTGGNACLWNASGPPAKKVDDPVVLAAIETRKSLKLSQATFARCLGISPRTVGEWEQGRRQPSGAARTLLYWASQRPDYLKLALRAYRADKA
ncbi:hypothetical protein GCM10011352_04910 [Marinobacterium zhoushanense]|uniref:HTH cro/C1-type domain-containing protein n=1 Tax=Marinobacterium zhoushanense TaxID=1679163 RepID=A0ABQ1K2S0_9GAMM|nr:helix-turn-helix domain-containing protein [Marinobacterium zhoushanense]GGB82113.1 hypothetical protein GCM10011352_04910 [Marinobacterium zhoushanense]